VCDEESPKEKTARLRRTNIVFDKMEDIEERAGLPLESQRPSVIPEDFLWHVFEPLVDALTILHQGNKTVSEGKPWREIVRGDIHCANIFIRPGEDQKGEVVSQSKYEEDDDMQTLSFESDNVSLYFKHIQQNL
jgi:hypothetical protein